MIVAGDNQTFAIAAEVTEISGSWMLGRFRFVLHGRPCGNWNDETDLRACHSWLKDFSENPRPRFEPGLLTFSAIEVFERLVKPVLVQESELRTPELYTDTFSRFHISHLGMSSFNNVIMILIENSELQRCVWQASKDDSIHDETFSSGQMQRVAREFCTLIEREASAIGFVI